MSSEKLNLAGTKRKQSVQTIVSSQNFRRTTKKKDFFLKQRKSKTSSHLVSSQSLLSDLNKVKSSQESLSQAAKLKREKSFYSYEKDFGFTSNLERQSSATAVTSSNETSFKIICEKWNKVRPSSFHESTLRSSRSEFFTNNNYTKKDETFPTSFWKNFVHTRLTSKNRLKDMQLKEKEKSTDFDLNTFQNSSAKNDAKTDVL